MTKWYGVKTVYMVTASGRSAKPVSKSSVLIEERVVLFKARSFDSAIKKAEKEALQYSKGEYKNVYGQKVKMKYLNCCDAFELYDDPEAGVEVFSLTEVHLSKPRKSEIINAKLGPAHGSKESALRKKFLNREFNKPE